MDEVFGLSKVKRIRKSMNRSRERSAFKLQKDILVCFRENKIKFNKLMV